MFQISKILIYNTAANNSGALSILHSFYEKASNDCDNKYEFILSLPVFQETKNVKIKRFPWIKQSWLHRIYFDLFIANRIVREIKPDEVISLQGLIIPFCKGKQTLYIQNSLFFSEYRIGIFTNFNLWVRQNVLGYLVKYSIKHANKIITQTRTVKNACVRECKIDDSLVVVEYPRIDVKMIKKFNEQVDCNTFFYPATPLEYKNHIGIVKACMELKRKGLTDYTVIFTVEGTETKCAKYLIKLVDKYKLPIKFIGFLKRSEVFKWYSKSILLFPSFIESFPVPLTEAMLSNTPIISANMEYAREILNGYKKVNYFEANNYKRLAFLMEKQILY